MKRALMRYAYRVARECKKQKPMDMKQAKLTLALASIREIFRAKE
jgi:hypothetical protein